MNGAIIPNRQEFLLKSMQRTGNTDSAGLISLTLGSCDGKYIPIAMYGNGTGVGIGRCYFDIFGFDNVWHAKVTYYDGTIQASKPVDATIYYLEKI